MDYTYKLYDRRTKQYLVSAPDPKKGAGPSGFARWSAHALTAGTFTKDEVEQLRAIWPYAVDCEMRRVVHVEQGNERELYTQEIEGWRAWDVVRLGKLYRLRSVTHGTTVGFGHWPTDDWIHAVCEEERFCSKSSDGRVPGENCSCGLYAASSLKHLTEELSYAHYDDSKDAESIRVIGRVLMAGKVIVGTQGWKAERARVGHLYVPHNHWQVGKALSEQYRVPYDTLRWIGK